MKAAGAPTDTWGGGLPAIIGWKQTGIVTQLIHLLMT